MQSQHDSQTSGTARSGSLRMRTGALASTERPGSSSTRSAVAPVSFVGGTAAMFVLTRTFKRKARWRTFWPVSLALALAEPIVFFVQGEGPWVGLYRQMLVGMITLRPILGAFRLRPLAGAAATGPRESMRIAPRRPVVAKGMGRDRTYTTDGSEAGRA